MCRCYGSTTSVASTDPRVLSHLPWGVYLLDAAHLDMWEHCMYPCADKCLCVNVSLEDRSEDMLTFWLPHPKTNGFLINEIRD